MTALPPFMPPRQTRSPGTHLSSSPWTVRLLVVTRSTESHPLLPAVAFDSTSHAGNAPKGTGRYPPQPKFEPFAFYSCFRLGDPEQAAIIMDTDPYYWTQDNGAGGPVHFATTYKQIDMLHHIIRNCPQAINQRDIRGFTPLHRAAYLAQYDGYMELYEYLLSEGADPAVLTEDYDPYLNPGRKTPVEVAIKDGPTRDALRFLEEKYADTPKKPRAHPDIGDWWALYDYGPETVYGWKSDFEPDYPERRRAAKDAAEKREWKRKRKAARDAAIAAEVATREDAQKPADALPIGALKVSDEKTETDVAKDSTPLPASAAAAAAADAADASSPVAFLFPGQGSQKVGMLASAAAEIPAVRAMCDKAREILGYDLLDVCVNGPKEKLDDTAFAQPALFVAGLAAAEKLKAESPEIVARCSRVAGLSLGEYTALVFAGAMSFEDGLRVVRCRAEAMKAAAAEGDHGMLSVVGLDDDVLETCVEKARLAAAKRREASPDDASKDVVCAIANYLFPTGRVVSGDADALDEVARLATEAGAMKTAKVAVSGAFHTERMASARDALREALAGATVREPKIATYSNVTGTFFESAAAIPEALASQLVSPVRWEDTLRALVAEGKDEMYELGPMKQIKAMARRVSAEAAAKFKNVDVA